MNELKINFDKQKIFQRIILSVFLLLIGVWFALGDTTILNQIPKLDDPALTKFLGWFTISLVIIMIIFLVNCLLKNDSGFIIDEIGFEDNTQIISKGRLFWSEIQTIENSSLVSMNVIKINFKDSSQKPRYFSSALLKISQAELFEKLNSKFKETTANRR